MTHRNICRRPLTDLQQAILDHLWTRGPATAEQIRQALEASHPLKDSSMRTLLRRLEAQGFLRHTVDGKVFVYQAAVPPASLAARAVQHIIEKFWAGSAEQFLVGMVDEKILSLDEIERLAKKVRKR